MLSGMTPAPLALLPLADAIALPPSRTERRNLVSGDQLLGLRGWDIPHDRHMTLCNLKDGDADITGADLPQTWYDHWQLSLMLDGRETVLRVSLDEWIFVPRI